MFAKSHRERSRQLTSLDIWNHRNILPITMQRKAWIETYPAYFNLYKLHVQTITATSGLTWMALRIDLYACLFRNQCGVMASFRLQIEKSGFKSPLKHGAHESFLVFIPGWVHFSQGKSQKLSGWTNAWHAEDLRQRFWINIFRWNHVMWKKAHCLTRSLGASANQSWPMVCFIEGRKALNWSSGMISCSYFCVSGFTWCMWFHMA